MNSGKKTIKNTLLILTYKSILVQIAENGGSKRAEKKVCVWGGQGHAHYYKYNFERLVN